MLRYLVTEILYISYLGGVFLICAHHLSVALFERAKPYRKQRTALSNLLFALVWPIALFSKSGRDELKHKLINFF